MILKSINPITFVIIGILTTSIAQIVLKIGSSFNVLSKHWLISLCLSLITYIISFVCYYLALRYYDVSKLSPLMMVSTVLIITLFGFYSGENISTMRLIGIFLAIMCILFISRS